MSTEKEQALIKGLVDIASWVNCDTLPIAQTHKDDDLVKSIIFITKLASDALEEAGCGKLELSEWVN